MSPINFRPYYLAKRAVVVFPTTFLVWIGVMQLWVALARASR